MNLISFLLLARIILFDKPSFVDKTAICNWCDALENVMSVACSLNGASRIPFIGLICMNSYPEVLFPLQPLRGNFARFEVALNEIRGGLDYCHQVTCSSSTTISEAIKQGLSMFRRQAQGLLQTAGYWSQLELTLITGQEVTRLLKAVKSIVLQLNLEGIKPLVTKATSCWRIDWDELETNQQHFQALCHMLAEKDEVLLAQAIWDDQNQNRAFRYTIDVPKPNGIFLLLPSHKGSLLIKPIATRELILPVKTTVCDQPTENYISNITRSLDMVIYKHEIYNFMLAKSLIQNKAQQPFITNPENEFCAKSAASSSAEFPIEL
ncbi:hypothetical protein LSH36_255g01008 [Paralvinella palmiformis]|uniref:Uncharacterized protein n=1 Tax=Paralvinella palmiformis TaxID=53620 RepID=A0AAD9JKG3_9ANNE|nr:hypothetical protein LSH36_255g01008 [Paralvinella palmiformis]